MTVWDPKDQSYAEWQGVITLDVQVALRATSGEGKHTDPQEQGAFLAGLVQSTLERTYGDSDDVRVGEVQVGGRREGRWTEWT